MMEHLAIVLWLALAPCQGDACASPAWEPSAIYQGADLCEAAAERSGGDALCLPRGWLPPVPPDQDYIPRRWQARI